MYRALRLWYIYQGSGGYTSGSRINKNFSLSHEEWLALNLSLTDTPQFSFTQSSDFNASYEPTITSQYILVLTKC